MKRIATYKDFIGELNIIYRRTSLPTRQILTSSDVFDFIFPFYDEIMDTREEFKIIHLSNNNNVVNVDNHSIGGRVGTVIDIPTVLRNILHINTHGIILVHNHPSGKLVPSQADIDVTNKIKKGCDAIGIRLLDHIIITREKHYSFVDEGLL
ncbi:RadC-like JAB domain-containing protein [Tenacibaculum sp. MAR_2009_124]|uniref:JAB domain-containing protein n=1 Tax=Tenacibaculum sp. MAR_2009_124 TaxID=1250059 RepID=UPI0008998BB0|nr:JAB domain-containing protein [Tenacibaculum sp. MAR_2009_124]SEC66776.1 RadC-like JAB domain-containing protein [Tenacibaculum sp. MAR_2009_124]